jgi:hypothetical protein
MISFKSELIAIILTLFVSRETSYVTIYTDSKSVIDKFNALNSEVNRFSSSRHNTKLQYFKYWALLFHLIETLRLKVQFKKVKAHRGNRFNEEVDKLAKAASSLTEGLALNTNNFANVGINFKHIEIEDHLRGFIKTITNVNRFSQFLALNRNSKYRKSDIDWPISCSIIKGIEASNTTSFNYSYHRSKHMKLLLEELPTIEFYKATKPDLYKDSWNCLYCNTTETFNHLWTCSTRLSQMNNIISDTKKLLRNTINLVYKADVNLQNNLNFIMDHRSWWLPIYDPLHITFVDLIKGIVPRDLSKAINAITNSKQATAELLGILYDFIYDYSNHYWNERCTRMIQEELRMGITTKLKRTSSNILNNFSRSHYVDQDIYNSLEDYIVGDMVMNQVVSTNNHYLNFCRGLDLIFKPTATLVRIFCRIRGW